MADKELHIKVGVISTVARAFSRLRQQTGKLRSSLKDTQPQMRGLGKAAQRTGTAMAGPATRGAKRLTKQTKELKKEAGLARRILGGLGGILRGVFTAGLFAAAGAAIALRGAFSAMYDAMEGGEGAAGALEDVDDQAAAAAEGLSDAAAASETAAQQAQVAFGAWGKVGEGYVQAQGRILEKTEQTAASAIDTAESVADAMDTAETGIDGATQATTRFGRAANRIGAAFAKAKRIILQAIAKAITPTLEAFADFLESPIFQEFIKLLAEDLADAAREVGVWFNQVVIPAIGDFMIAVNKAGGPVAFLKKKWEDFKSAMLKILDFILDKWLIWPREIQKIFQRVFEAISPTLEALGKLLKSPVFKKFADFLAKDLTKAAGKSADKFKEIIALLGDKLVKAVGKLSDWFVKKAIPAIEDFMEQIIEVGGPIEFFKQKWEELKTTVLMILAIIVGRLLIWSNTIRDIFRRVVDYVKNQWQGLKNSIISILEEIGARAQNILAGVVSFVKGVWNAFISAIENAINAAVDILNEFIHLYNVIARFSRGRTISMMGHVHIPRLQEGGIAFDPTLAVVGDAPSPEVIAPLDELVGILQEALGAGGMTINVTVPPGTLDPMGYGDAVGRSIVTAMRRSGQRVPAI